MNVPPAFELRGIVKRFGARCVASDDVSFTVTSGSIHGVVGENGAGKSTIMKVLYGMHAPDTGEIFVRGEKVNIPGPDAAIALGVGMVHQHFMLVPTLSVWENVVLGKEEGFRLRKASYLKQLDTLQKSFGFSLPLEAAVEDLPVGHQQQVEILKLLYRDSSILILDEPTAVLTPGEVHALFERLRSLRDSGKTIVLVSHKLKEILEFTDTVTVMRQGKAVATVRTRDLSEESLAEKIIGRKLVHLPDARPAPGKDPILTVERVTTGPGKSDLKDVSFTIHQGEIVGIAGVEGNGQRELVEVLAGVRRRYRGEARYLGKPLRQWGTYGARQSGLGLIPPDRHREAIVLGFRVWENYLLGHHREARFSRGRWLSRGSVASALTPAMERFDVRPRNPALPVESLSGGNQQKLVLARELGDKLKLCIAAHPTRGVDIGAIEFIHAQFLALRAQGAAILVVSSELDEILALSDRILVLFEGRVQGEVPRRDATEAKLGLWMTGGKA